MNEVPDSPLLQLATAAMSQARQIVPPPVSTATASSDNLRRNAPQSVERTQESSVTSTESYIDSDASRSPKYSSSRGMFYHENNFNF